MRIHRTVQIIVLLLFIMVLVAPAGQVYGYTPTVSTWKQVETKYTVINYKSSQDLSKFNRKIIFGKELSRIENRLLGFNPEKLTQNVRVKVDGIFNRVHHILDMNRKMPKVSINIYSNKKDLNDAYYKLYNEPCQIRAWYIYDSNTIYINVNDLHEGILAHEIAHSVIDHYLMISPPTATAEILARYVEAHLKDNSAVDVSSKETHAAYTHKKGSNH